MTTYTPSQLVNVQWKPCTRCLGIPPLKILMVDKESYVCPNCLGHGKEPVEMKNEIINTPNGHRLKYQVGVEFAISKGSEHIKLEDTQTFLLLRPKVEGDDSILMVLPQY